MCDNYACQSRIRALSELKDFSLERPSNFVWCRELQIANGSYLLSWVLVEIAHLANDWNWRISLTLML